MKRQKLFAPRRTGKKLSTCSFQNVSTFNSFPRVSNYIWDKNKFQWITVFIKRVNSDNRQTVIKCRIERDMQVQMIPATQGQDVSWLQAKLSQGSSKPDGSRRHWGIGFFFPCSCIDLWVPKNNLLGLKKQYVCSRSSVDIIIPVYDWAIDFAYLNEFNNFIIHHCIRIGRITETFFR